MNPLEEVTRLMEAFQAVPEDEQPVVAAALLALGFMGIVLVRDGAKDDHEGMEIDHSLAILAEPCGVALKVLSERLHLDEKPIMDFAMAATKTHLELRMKGIERQDVFNGMIGALREGTGMLKVPGLQELMKILFSND